MNTRKANPSMFVSTGLRFGNIYGISQAVAARGLA